MEELNPYAAAAAAIVGPPKARAGGDEEMAAAAAAGGDAAASASGAEEADADGAAEPDASNTTLGADHVEGVALAHKIHLTFEQQALGGRFYRVGRERQARREAARAAKAAEDAPMPKGGGLSWLSDVVTNVSRLSATFTRFAQGLLGGFALLNLYMTYAFTGGSGDRWLAFYSPLASSSSTTFHVLGTVALLGTLDRYFRERAAGWPRGLAQANSVRLMVGLYAMAFVLTLVCSHFEEVLFYTNERVPGWWELYPQTKSFKSRKTTYLTLNFFRVLLHGLGWLVVNASDPHLVRLTH